MTAENPAITLHKAWDGIYRATNQCDDSLMEHLDQIGTRLGKGGAASPSLDDVEHQGSTRYWRARQMIDHGTHISPVAQSQGQIIYEMTWARSHWGRQSLFQLDSLGNFRLGTAFAGTPTRGVYDRVESHTFLGWSRLYRVKYRPLAWFYGGLGQRTWCDPTDWRAHLYYWHAGSLRSDAWLQLRAVGDTWRVAPTPGQVGSSSHEYALNQDYALVEQRYAKHRRKYFRNQGIPDPERPLSPTEIETVDYLTQHLHTYEPPKAQLPA